MLENRNVKFENIDEKNGEEIKKLFVLLKVILFEEFMEVMKFCLKWKVWGNGEN